MTQHAVILLIVLGLTAVPCTGATTQDSEIQQLSRNLVAQLESAGQKSVTILDFTDLQGQGTELGRYLAQEVSDRSFSAANRLSFVDRVNLQHLLRENKLSVDGLVNPQSARKLGNLIGIDTIVFGTVTPVGKVVRLSVRAVSVETGRIVASQTISLPVSGELAELYTRGLPVQSVPAAAGGTALPDVRTRFRNDSIKIIGRFVRYTKWLDGSNSCFNGDSCATASVLLQNLSGVGLNVALKSGATSIGSCVGDESAVGGLKLYAANRAGRPQEFESVQTYIPAGAEIPITVKLGSCSASGVANVDVSLMLAVSVENKVFDLPVSALNVKVQ